MRRIIIAFRQGLAARVAERGSARTVDSGSAGEFGDGGAGRYRRRGPPFPLAHGSRFSPQLRRSALQPAIRRRRRGKPEHPPAVGHPACRCRRRCRRAGTATAHVLMCANNYRCWRAWHHVRRRGQALYSLISSSDRRFHSCFPCHTPKEGGAKCIPATVFRQAP
jgi:hypothetical protein